MYLPKSGEDVLNRVALVGSSDVLRPKFFLGRLASHRGKSVDQLISESVAAYLDRVGFSDTGEVSRLLEAIRVPLDPIRRFYAPLGSLMARRHQIVHKGDLLDAPSDGPREAMTIDGTVVMEWHAAVKAFMSAVIAQKIEHDFAAKLSAESKLRRLKMTTSPNRALQRTAAPPSAVAELWGAGPQEALMKHALLRIAAVIITTTASAETFDYSPRDDFRDYYSYWLAGDSRIADSRDGQPRNPHDQET